MSRRVLRDLASKNLIKHVGDHHAAFNLYTGTQLKAPEPVKGEKAPQQQKGKAPAKEKAAEKEEAPKTE